MAAVQKNNKEIYGAVIDEAGKGFYIGAELFAILSSLARESRASSDMSVLRHESNDLEYRRASTWLAQILATTPMVDILEESERNIETESLQDTDRESILAAREAIKAYQSLIHRGHDRTNLAEVADQVGDLLRALLIPRPFEKKTAAQKSARWQTYLFSALYPELASDETVLKKGGRVVARSQYRGAGALAYQMLARDNDEERRIATDQALVRLLQERTGPLPQLLDEMRLKSNASLSVLDTDSPKRVPTLKDFTKEIDTESARMFRVSVHRILNNQSISHIRRTKYIMFMSGFFVARHVLETAVPSVGDRSGPFALCEFGTDHNLWTASRDLCARHRRQLASFDRSNCAKTKAVTFFEKTMQNIGFYDLRGSYYATRPKYPFVEALIFATCSEDELREGMGIDQFDERLWDELGIVIGPRSADAARGIGFNTGLPSSMFANNINSLARIIEDLGLLSSYSDSTRLITAGE